jgi:hypothetical protein
VGDDPPGGGGDGAVGDRLRQELGPGPGLGQTRLGGLDLLGAGQAPELAQGLGRRTLLGRSDRQPGFCVVTLLRGDAPCFEELAHPRGVVAGDLERRHGLRQGGLGLPDVLDPRPLDEQGELGFG